MENTDLSLDMAFKVIDEQRKEIEQLQSITTEQDKKNKAVIKSFFDIVGMLTDSYGKIADKQRIITEYEKTLTRIFYSAIDGKYEYSPFIEDDKELRDLIQRKILELDIIQKQEERFKIYNKLKAMSNE